MELTATNVHETFMECLFTEEEAVSIDRNDKTQFIETKGVMIHVGFNPKRIEENKTSIIEMIDCLHNNFKETGGGGWSFLKLCSDKDGNQWTDLQQTADELVCLGLAIDRIEFSMSRELWSELPGGVPYLRIKNK